MKTREKLTYERVKGLINILAELGVLDDPIRHDLQINTELGDASDLVDSVKKTPLVSVSSETIVNDGVDTVDVTILHDRNTEGEVTDLYIGGEKYEIDLSSGEYVETVTTTATNTDYISVYCRSSIFGSSNVVEIEVTN